jgi:hypothetical protein
MRPAAGSSTAPGGVLPKATSDGAVAPSCSVGRRSSEARQSGELMTACAGGCPPARPGVAFPRNDPDGLPDESYTRLEGIGMETLPADTTA